VSLDHPRALVVAPTRVGAHSSTRLCTGTVDTGLPGCVKSPRVPLSDPFSSFPRKQESRASTRRASSLPQPSRGLAGMGDRERPEPGNSVSAAKLERFYRRRIAEKLYTPIKPINQPHRFRWSHAATSDLAGFLHIPSALSNHRTGGSVAGATEEVRRARTSWLPAPAPHFRLWLPSFHTRTERGSYRTPP
jgi:hypothetical protein